MKSRSKARQVGHQDYSAVAEHERQDNSLSFSIDDQRITSVSQRKIGEMMNSFAEKQYQPQSAVSAVDPIQRRVGNFNADSTARRSPYNDLRNTVDYNYFNEGNMYVNGRFATKLNYTGGANPNRTTRLRARVNGNVGFGHDVGRAGTSQTNTGHVGRDEFFIRRGKQVAWEGGHIIPLRYFDDRDVDQGEANHYHNLAPMTRTMNMIDWPVAERGMDNWYNHDYDIRLTRGVYDVSYDQLARSFGLTVDGTHNGGGTDTITMWEWIPTNVNVDKTRHHDGGNHSNDDYTELGMYKTGDPGSIDQGNGAQLQGLLNGYGVRDTFTGAMWTGIGNL